MISLSILPATSENVQLIADLSRKTFYDTFHEQNTAENMQMFLEKNFNYNMVEREMNDPENTFVVASEDDRVVGYVKLSTFLTWPESDTTEGLEIARLYVVKESIGKGIGKLLMEYCIQTAIEKRNKALWLGVWEHNKRAINFYESFGFKKINEHVFMLGSDEQNDWLMKKELTG